MKCCQPLCYRKEDGFANTSKEKESFSISFLSGRRFYITGSLVCQDGLIYEYLPDIIHNGSIRLHVYFIPSFKSQWPIRQSMRCRLLIKESNCWSCILRMSKELEMVFAKFYSWNSNVNCMENSVLFKEKLLNHAIWQVWIVAIRKYGTMISLKETRLQLKSFLSVVAASITDTFSPSEKCVIVAKH